MTNQTEDLTLKKSELNPLLFCIAITIVQMFGIDMYIPSMPYISNSLHTSQTVIQLTVAFYVLGAAFSTLFSGPLSDKIGRKPVISMGLFGMLLGAILCFFSETGSLLLLGRIIQGIGAGFCMSANRAVVTDIFSAKKLAIIGVYFSIFLAISPIIAPIVGGYLEHYYNWRANFLVLSVSYLIIFLLFSLFFKETIHEKHSDKLSVSFILNRYRYLLTQAPFVIYALCGGLALCVSIAYATSASFVFQKTLGVSPIMFGWFGIFVGAGNILGKITTASLVKRFKMENVFITGIFVILFSGIFMFSAIQLNELSITIALIAIVGTLFGQTYVMTNAFALGITPYRHMGGAANAILSSGQMALSFFVSGLLSLSSGHIAESNALAFSYIAIGALCIIIFFPYFLKNRRI